MAASEVVALVNALASSQDKLDKLEELKILLSSVSPQELRTVVSNVPILLIFECLNTDDTAQLEVCCSVLERLLSVLNSNAILENLHREFVQWLNQGTVPVQTLCLSQLLRVSKESPELLVQCDDSLVVGVTKQLANANTAAAQLAITILVHIGSVAGGLPRVYGGDVFHTLQTVMAKNDTVRYRVYQLVVELCQVSPEALTAADRCGMLGKLIGEMDNEDILIQLNCVEMLSELARSNHGLTYLDNQGIIKRLETLMANTHESPFGAFLLPGLMKFFGGLARFHPKEVMASFQTFVGLVFRSVGGEGDPSVRGLAIDTVGFIGCSPEGKSALEKQGAAMSQCVSNLGGVIKNSPSDLRTRALQAVASLMRLQVAEQTEDLLRITETWFNQLCPRPFDVIWGIAKQPFTDLRLAALQVLESLAFLPWGQRLMNDAAGFKEYLFDRAVETCKESREAKFGVVQVLLESPTMRQVFGEAYYVQMMEFVQQGPFFVRAQAEVAFEEA